MRTARWLVLRCTLDVRSGRVGQDSYRRSYAALKPGGLLVAYGYSAGVQPQRRLLSLLTSLARVYLCADCCACCPVASAPTSTRSTSCGRGIPRGSKRTWSGFLACWQLAPSARASPSGSRSTRLSRRIAALKREGSMESSSYARTEFARVGCTDASQPRHLVVVAGRAPNAAGCWPCWALGRHAPNSNAGDGAARLYFLAS